MIEIVTVALLAAEVVALSLFSWRCLGGPLAWVSVLLDDYGRAVR